MGLLVFYLVKSIAVAFLHCRQQTIITKMSNVEPEVGVPSTANIVHRD